jgi:hypothetical protein
VFDPSEKSLVGCHYGNDESVQNAMCQGLQRMESILYGVGIRAVVQRWKRTVDRDGDHIGK